ncbi:hypothetical protein Peur_034168 [Populus x canadensis]
MKESSRVGWHFLFYLYLSGTSSCTTDGLCMEPTIPCGPFPRIICSCRFL